MPYGIPACKNRKLMIHNNKFFQEDVFFLFADSERMVDHLKFTKNVNWEKTTVSFDPKQPIVFHLTIMTYNSRNGF